MEDDDHLIILSTPAAALTAPPVPPVDTAAPLLPTSGAPDQFLPFFWYSYSVHKALNSQNDHPLSLQYSQVQVTLALQRLLNPRNMVSISYSDADNDSIGRHEGSALIRCLNAAVYTYWSNKRAVPFLGKFIDFIPHRRSISSANPNDESRAQDARPTREIIADEVTALKNQFTPGPSISQMENSLKEVEARIEAKLEGLRDNINTHTTHKIAESTTSNSSHQDLLLQQLQLLTNASAEYNRKMVGISSAIARGQDELPPARLPAPQPARK